MKDAALNKQSCGLFIASERQHSCFNGFVEDKNASSLYERSDERAKRGQIVFRAAKDGES